MRKLKKLLSVILVTTIVFTTFSIGISVSAENIATETNETTESPLKIEVTTDKSSYGKFNVADITVNITNTSDDTIENISANAIFDDLAPVDSLYSETSKKVEELKPGGNFSFSYKAILNYKNPDVGFFSKIILWFVWLFNDGYTVISGDSKADIENVTEIKFGKVSADNVIYTYYSKNNNNSNDDNIEVAKFLGKDISEVIKEYGSNYVEESIEGGHYYVYNNVLAFGITENAYAGFEPKNVVSISAVTTNVNFYQGFSSNMSYNDLVKLVPSIEKPQYFYNELTDEDMYSTYFIYKNYLFVYIWNEYLSDDDICYQASVTLYGNGIKEMS